MTVSLPRAKAGEGGPGLGSGPRRSAAADRAPVGGGQQARVAGPMTCARLCGGAVTAGQTAMPAVLVPLGNAAPPPQGP
jgi:hypothetical protein